jgi:hypothetical protein
MGFADIGSAAVSRLLLTYFYIGSTCRVTEETADALITPD